MLKAKIIKGLFFNNQKKFSTNRSTNGSLKINFQLKTPYILETFGVPSMKLYFEYVKAILKNQQHENTKTDFQNKAGNIQQKLKQWQEEIQTLQNQINVHQYNEQGIEEPKEPDLINQEAKKIPMTDIKYYTPQQFDQLILAQNRLQQELKQYYENKNKNDKQVAFLEGQKKYLQEIKEKKEKIQSNQPEGKKMHYDLEIDSYTLLSLVEGCQVIIHDQEIYKQNKNRECYLYSFVGQFNVGKTFWANKISGFILDTGYQTETRPLCLKLSEEAGKHNLVGVLDTAGKGRAIRQYLVKQKPDINPNQLFQALRQDKQAIDYFNEEFIINKANCIIIVVGHLKQEEQTYIEKVKQLIYTQKKKQQLLIILHNFDKALNIQEIKQRIQDDIVGCFDVKQKPMNEEIYKNFKNSFCEYFEENLNLIQQDNGLRIIHLAVGNDNFLDIENYYNHTAVAFLKSLKTKSDKRDLIEEYRQFFHEKCHNYLDLIYPEQNQKPYLDFDEDKKLLKLKFITNGKQMPQEISVDECHNYFKVKPLQFNKRLGFLEMAQNQDVYNYLEKDFKNQRILIYLEQPGEIITELNQIQDQKFKEKLQTDNKESFTAILKKNKTTGKYQLQTKFAINFPFKHQYGQQKLIELDIDLGEEDYRINDPDIQQLLVYQELGYIIIELQVTPQQLQQEGVKPKPRLIKIKKETNQIQDKGTKEK